MPLSKTKLKRSKLQIKHQSQNFKGQAIDIKVQPQVIDISGSWKNGTNYEMAKTVSGQTVITL